ncbi:hypothetical protein F183_A05400 [Bryobacterales bacterium F-183]|nr:hypothetical protein F183_A05400 [Bryobacterales bacterium F-183]
MQATHDASHDHHGEHEGHSHGGLKQYLAVLGALLVLTVITVGASYLDFGSANIVIAVLIATIKASLVALFFMHLKDDNPVNAMILVSCFLFLGLLLTFCLLDIDNRLDESPAGKAAMKMQGPPSMGRSQTSTDAAPAPKPGYVDSHGAGAGAGEHGGAAAPAAKH